MTLTLGNDLTGSVAREVSEASRKSSGLGESLTTGNNKFVEVVDGFLGRSLRDNEMILGAIAKNTAYSINMLTITDEYLKTISTALQEGLKTIGSAGPLSADKLAVLQKNLNDKRSQVDLMIKTADFDGKALLAGGAKETDVQVGLSITDKLTLKVNDIGSGKLFRSSVTNALNEYLSADAARSNHYTGAGNAQAFTDAKAANTNLIYTSLTAGVNQMTAAQLGAALHHVIQNSTSMDVFLEKALPKSVAALGHTGATFANATALQLQTAFNTYTPATAAAALQVVGGAVADGQNTQDTADAVRDVIVGADVPQAVKDAARAAARAGGFANHNAARTAVRTAAINADLITQIMHLTNPIGAPELQGNGAIANFGAAVGDANAANAAIAGSNLPQALKDAAAAAAAAPAATVDDVALATLNVTSNELLGILRNDLSTNITEAGNKVNRVIAQDVMQAALNTIRAEQASVSSQKQNVIEAADALRSTTNVTQKSADSYLKTDYVITAQQYSETIRTMVASITALQAANKIPEAAQRLIDALAR